MMERTRWFAVTGAFVLLVLADGTMASAQSPSESLPPVGDERVTVDVYREDVRRLVTTLAAYGELDVVFDDGVDGTVTATLREVPLREALRAVLAAGGLTWCYYARTTLWVAPHGIHCGASP